MAQNKSDEEATAARNLSKREREEDEKQVVVIWRRLAEHQRHAYWKPFPLTQAEYDLMQRYFAPCNNLALFMNNPIMLITDTQERA